MNKDCIGCVCSVPERSAATGRLVLATQIDHTASALRSLATRHGSRLEVLGPGLLELLTDDVQPFLEVARSGLSSVEAAEVRCLVTTVGADGIELVGQALRAPTLAVSAARVTHADLLPLFDDESRAFHSVYQPIVELAGGRTIGHEALLRASSADGSPIYPDVLFPAAEAAGWTHVLDRIGRTTALREAGSWLGEDLLFINFIPTSIYRPQVCLRTTEQAADEAGLNLNQLVFEVTEGHRIDDIDHLADVFAYYRAKGCRVALDDLGAGYSSLNLLVRLQPDFVKLDKDIVQALPDPVSSAVVAAIVSITHAYGGTVLAECIETQEQADAARALGVDLGQGWLFGRPVRPSADRGARQPVAAPPRPVHPAPAIVRDGAPSGPVAGLEALLARAVASSANGVVVVDASLPDWPVIHVNDAFERMAGYSRAEVVGRNCRLMQGPGTDSRTAEGISAAIKAGVEHTCVLQNVRKDGTTWWNELHLSPLRDEQDRLTHYLGFQYDVTGRVEAEEQLRVLAVHDGLTGVLNRSALLLELEAALAVSARDGRTTAVLFLDLDGFKAVNDSYGHLVGDRVLAEMASRLTAALRSRDVVARHGGDEFVVVLSDLEPLDAERIAHRAASDLVDAVQRPVPIGAEVARLGASVGIALQRAGSTAVQLLRAADAAMYDVKRTRPGGLAVAQNDSRDG